MLLEEGLVFISSRPKPCSRSSCQSRLAPHQTRRNALGADGLHVETWVLSKLCPAFFDAEIVSLAFVFHPDRCPGFADSHAANWICHEILTLILLNLLKAEVSTNEIVDLFLNPGDELWLIHALQGKGELVRALEWEENGQDLQL